MCLKQSKLKFWAWRHLIAALKGLLSVHACVRTPKALSICTPAGMGVRWPCLITAHLSAVSNSHVQSWFFSNKRGRCSVFPLASPLPLLQIRHLPCSNLPRVVCNVFHRTNYTAYTQGGRKIINRVLNLKEQSADSGMMPIGLKGSYREINSVVGGVTCRMQV